MGASTSLGHGHKHEFGEWGQSTSLGDGSKHELGAQDGSKHEFGAWTQARVRGITLTLTCAYRPHATPQTLTTRFRTLRHTFVSVWHLPPLRQLPLQIASRSLQDRFTIASRSLQDRFRAFHACSSVSHYTTNTHTTFPVTQTHFDSVCRSKN